MPKFAHLVLPGHSTRQLSATPPTAEQISRYTQTLQMMSGGCRGLSEAKKAFLYDTSVELGKAEDSSAADDAAATKVLSEMKQLELSGSVANILLPTEDTAEVGPPSFTAHIMFQCTAGEVEGSVLGHMHVNPTSIIHSADSNLAVQ